MPVDPLELQLQDQSQLASLQHPSVYLPATGFLAKKVTKHFDITRTVVLCIVVSEQ